MKTLMLGLNVLLWLVLFLNPCASSEPDPKSSNGSDGFSADRANGESIAVVADTTEPEGASISFDEVLQAALFKNPQLEAATLGVEAQQAAVRQETLWPNPSISVEFEGLAGTGETRGLGPTETSVGISQPFLSTGKRSKRETFAKLQAVEANLELQAAILELKREVRERFVILTSLQDKVSMETENLRLVQGVHDAVARKVEAGESSPLDQTKAGIELGHVQASLARMEYEFDAAKIALASTWNSTTPRFDTVKGDIARRWAVPSVSVLLEESRGHPHLVQSELKIRQREAELQLARADAWPDFELGGGIKHTRESDEKSFFFGVSVPLPVFDRNQGGIDEAIKRLEQSRIEWEAQRLRWETQIRELVEHLRGKESEIETVKEKILPVAENAYQGIERAYQVGEKDYLELLDAQRTLLESRRVLMDARVDFQQGRAELEFLAGSDMEAISNRQPESEESVE